MRIARLAALLAVALLVGYGARRHRRHRRAYGPARASCCARTSRRRRRSTARRRSPGTPCPARRTTSSSSRLSNTFRDNAVVYADQTSSPRSRRPAIMLPWITGIAAFAVRTRARDHDRRRDAVERSFGFDMVAPAAPTPLPSDPGLLRWSPAEGAAAYEVWFIDIRRKFGSVDRHERPRRARVLHLPSRPRNWMGTIRWRVRAIRADIVFASDSGTSRYNKLPAVQYGPWSPVYSSTNGASRRTPVHEPVQPDRARRTPSPTSSPTAATARRRTG